MGNLNPFSKPKTPKPAQIIAPSPVPAAVAAPTEDNSAQDIAKAQAAEKERLKRQRGRAATLLTGGRGVMGDDTSGLATKTLLGG
ncbi:MAG: hypothetical protein E6R04_06305 [Spirochaetes bacterium]|nr:MAG: hypothetical protein E6R04_06305 [Spirochaetota bacterium]